jgi:hypothetical protein
VAVKSFATPAHRDLIDMVMTVKKSSQVTGLENVSKTKIRGVLALLKHGELLITQGDYGVPVRIYLAMGIDSFRDLRERHDTFLNMYMANHHLFIPTLLRNELVWNVDEATQNMRLEAIDKLTTKFKCILGAYPEYSQEHFGVGETSSMTSGLTSGNITLLRAVEAEAEAEAVSAVVPPPIGTTTSSSSSCSRSLALMDCTAPVQGVMLLLAVIPA